MAFSNTFASLSKVLSNDSPVELTISNNSTTIDPNTGNYFFLDNIDTNLTINLSNLTEGYTKTIYLRLNFDEDDIVLSWPNNIKWHEISPPAISAYEDLFISLMTLDGGTTWYSEPVIKVRPKVDLSYYMYNKYPGTYYNLTTLPVSDLSYFSSVRPVGSSSMFSGKNEYNSFIGTKITSIDLSMLDTSEITDMSYMFTGNTECTSIAGISEFDTHNVTNMRNMFEGCSSLLTLDISGWDVAKVSVENNSDDDLGDYGFFYMFRNCTSLNRLNVSGWNMNSNIAYMLNYFFYNCSSLTSLDLSSFTCQSKRLDEMFYGCSNLVTLDISNITPIKQNQSYGAYINSMFYGCSNLRYLILNTQTVKYIANSDVFTGNITRNEFPPSTCKILVPQTVLEDYVNNCMLSINGATFDAIENYTITRSNGQVTVTPNS